MRTIRKELRPDFATAEKLYPLVLKRLQAYENFVDAQAEDTPEEVFDKEYKAMEQELGQLTGKDLSDTWLWEWWEMNGMEAFAFDLAMPFATKHENLTREDLAAFVHIIIEEEFEAENDFQKEWMWYMFYNTGYFLQFLELNFRRYEYEYFTPKKNGEYYKPTVEEVVAKIWQEPRK